MISTDLFPIPFSVSHLWAMRGRCAVKKFSENVWKRILTWIISLKASRRNLIDVFSILRLLLSHIDHDSTSDSSQARNLLCWLRKQKKKLNTESQWVKREGKKNPSCYFSLFHNRLTCCSCCFHLQGYLQVECIVTNSLLRIREDIML